MIPLCQVPGCCKKAQNTRSNASPYYRRASWVREEYDVSAGYVCGTHHSRNVAKNRGLTSMAEVVAVNAGFATSSSYLNSVHPYRWYLNEQPTCENVDSRLGFKCTTTTFPGVGMLDVDHKDGDPTHNKRDNLQTLCKCCHSYKTHMYKDYATPGRKTLGVKY